MANGLSDAASVESRMGHIVVLDRARRATAALLDLLLDPVDAAAWLGRPPDLAANQIVSWGDVTPDQIRELLELTDDAEAAQHWRETLVTHAGRDLVISLVWPVET